VYAVRHKAIASNPVDGVDFSANSAQGRNRRHHPLTAEQVAAVAASIGTRHPREPGDRVQLQRIVTRSQLLTSNLQHPGAITLDICPPSWSQPRLSCHRTRVVPTGRTSERRPTSGMEVAGAVTTDTLQPLNGRRSTTVSSIVDPARSEICLVAILKVGADGASEMISSAPQSDYDPYTDEALLDPWLGYKRLRDAGSAVWLTRYQMFALTRYDAVRRALLDWECFPSRYGVMMNDRMNRVLRGNTLCSDGADHDALRSVLVRPLKPRALRPAREEITAEAESLVEKLVEQGSFDAATELANHLPVEVVSNLVGLPEQGRERMLVWAEELFNCFGPINDRTIASFPVLDEMMNYATTEAVPSKLKPGSWADGIHDAVARGEVPSQACPAMMIDYIGPSLDTTISAISNAVWLFANNPEQWDLLRADPRLMPSAISEVLRYDSPIQGFSRYVARDVDMGGVVLPAGSRAIVFYGAANRDERKYPDPDRFDIRRRPGDHLGFGAGPHACVGMNLARLEMQALFTALAKRVRRFTILEEEARLNNVLRGYKMLRVAVR